MSGSAEITRKYAMFSKIMFSFSEKNKKIYKNTAK